MDKEGKPSDKTRHKMRQSITPAKKNMTNQQIEDQVSTHLGCLIYCRYTNS